ncbi:MAG: AbrB/MazE/SpoVT family DNA-binding domain-containing protein [Thermoplasmata archaeon]
MKLRRVGSTLIVTIPKRIAEAMGWKAGNQLNIEVAGKDRLLIRR